MEKFLIEKPIRLIELFGGISCQAQALLNLGVEFENYRYCDFDKYACQSHNEIMGTSDQPSDITKWKGENLGVCDTDKFCYIMTYSFPCTDLSTAGKMAGMEKGSGTRSGLLWEVERLLKESAELPQVLLMENVPQVHGKKNKASFDEWCAFLESIGYKNYWKDLNAKDYGVPQSRNRCFMLSLLGDYSYEFPQPISLDKTLDDLLEKEVDERYYLSDRALNGCLNTNFHCNSLSARLPKDGITPTLCARDYKDPKLCQVKTFVSKKYNEFIEENGYVPDKFNPYNKTEIKDIAPTQSTYCGSTTSSATVLMKTNNKRQQELADNLDTSIDNQFLDFYNQTTQEKIAGTITTRVDASNSTGVYTNYRIRKLTPTEYLRLMGVRDEYSQRMTCSNAQKYKQAGNGIVVDVLIAIFKQLFQKN